MGTPSDLSFPHFDPLSSLRNTFARNFFSAQQLRHDLVMSKSFSQSDVASHNKPSDLYIIVDEDVYDLTKFQDEHPGRFS